MPVLLVQFVLVTALAIGPMARLSLADGFSPEESVEHMKAADGFRVELVAAEPLVRQPVAIEFDDRGRLWVIQYLQYPNPAGLKRVEVDRYSRTKYDRVPEPPPHGPRGADRITILEDTDGDGRMDRGRDFISGLNLATGLAFGHRGVYVLNVPYLLFYPDEDRDDVPDRDPEVLLNGFGMEDSHSVANSLTWGPDGWLYGCQGSTVTANIRGIQFQQGVWRYHPVTRQFELFCEGGGNSWGLDFDRTGNLFYSTNYGGFVLLHGVQGGYYVKSFAKHGELHNRHAYGYFDHAPHENFRGGHVTVGGIVYQGNSFPESFRGKYIGGDLLGHGVYWHHVKPHGSTVRTVHGGELLQSDDAWFAPTDVTMGPDGAVYVSDWHDARTAHPDPDAQWDRSNGRIFRIAYRGDDRVSGTKAKPDESGRDAISQSPLPRRIANSGDELGPQPPAPDFARLTEQELLDLHDHPSQWYVRRARVELAYRSRDPNDSAVGSAAVARLLERALIADEEVDALESLWTLAVVGGFDEAVARQLLQSRHPAVRSWTVRLLGDRGRVSDEMAHRLDAFAEREPAARVRRQLAATAKRLPAHQAVPVINANIHRDIDNDDPHLPLLWWWAVERHSITGREEVLRRFERPTLWDSRLGRDVLLPRLVRRYAAEASCDGLTSLVRLLRAAPDEKARRPLWEAVLAGWKEQEDTQSTGGDAAAEFTRAAATHEFSRLVLQAWKDEQADLALTELAIILQHREPLEAAIGEAFDDAAEANRRAALLATLSRTNEPRLMPLALKLVESDQPVRVRRAALGVLARSNDESVASRLLELHGSPATVELHSEIRDTLLSRESSAREFLAAVERGVISPESVPLGQIRRVLLLGNSQLDEIVSRHWGQLRPATPGEKLAEVRRLNNDLRAAAGNASAGKLLFQKHCANCHTLFGEGKKLGPDLTTANRMDRDFLLVSLVDPDSVIRKEFVSLVVQTTDGRVLTGLPIDRGEAGITLADGKSDQPVTIATSDIEQLHESPVSLMPSDLYRQFDPQQLRDLFRYLQSTDGS